MIADSAPHGLSGLNNRTIPNRFNIKASMIANMVTLISKNAKIIQVVIILVAVFMMDYMIRLQVKMVRYFSASDSTAHIPFFKVPSLQESVITLGRTEMVLLVPNTTLGAHCG